MNLLVLKLPPCMCAKSFQLCPTLCNPMDQALPSMGFSRQEYWSRLPCSPPGDLPDPGFEPMVPVAPVLQVNSLPLAPSGKLYGHLSQCTHLTGCMGPDISGMTLRICLCEKKGKNWGGSWDGWCITYLSLCDQLTLNPAAKNHKCWLSHTFLWDRDLGEADGEGSFGWAALVICSQAFSSRDGAAII